MDSEDKRARVSVSAAAAAAASVIGVCVVTSCEEKKKRHVHTCRQTVGQKTAAKLGVENAKEIRLPCFS